MSNLTPFYEAYGVWPGDRMYRADSVRVKIWQLSHFSRPFRLRFESQTGGITCGSS
jgi:hypothetical protein